MVLGVDVGEGDAGWVVRLSGCKDLLAESVHSIRRINLLWSRACAQDQSGLLSASVQIDRHGVCRSQLSTSPIGGRAARSGQPFRIASWITCPSCQSGSAWRCSRIAANWRPISALSAFFL